MAKIVDILVTGIDKDSSNPLQNSIVIKVKTGNVIKSFTSSYYGFNNYEDQYSSAQIEQFIDDAGSISLMKGMDRTYPIYEIDDDYYVILKNQYIRLKTTGHFGNQKIVDAYCAGLHDWENADVYKTGADVSKFGLAKAISKNFALNFSEFNIKLNNKKQNTNE